VWAALPDRQLTPEDPEVPLDRQAIEKRDFPIGRRGYDPSSVDAHLARLADEIESLGRQAKRRTGESLAQAASEQVRLIVQAAESSASEIEREAEDEAAQIRGDATRDAERTRADAIERASGHVGRVSSATSDMLERVEAMQRELGSLVETLRTGANRVNADLSLLESNMTELHQAAGSSSHSEDDLPHTPDTDSFGALPPQRAAAAPAAPVAPASAPAPVARREAPAPSSGGDIEGARLIALNMALNGQSRDETDRYLTENFELPDREVLLDEVYATVEVD
jgi:DivIVA domain-containing protein